ncbi:cupredoxin domain-containing protein [Candidatus Falkowbacteria bacterium]|nr:cupredoxin domain-containing protein [Candidatus Falkowbacteria bacterium]
MKLIKKIIVSGFLIGTVFLVACTNSDQNRDEDIIPTNQNQQDESDLDIDIKLDNEEDLGEVKEFNMIARQFEFEPKEIRVKKGDKVKFNIESVDVEHGISILEYGINVDLPVGETIAVEFTADKAGEFLLSCSVYCGGGHPIMTGKVIVE